MARRLIAREELRDEGSSLRQCIRPLVGEFLLLAKMRFARACSYKPNGLEGPLSEADCRHAVVTVGSSRFSGADLGG
jgi:hypothetical protein